MPFPKTNINIKWKHEELIISRTKLLHAFLAPTPQKATLRSACSAHTSTSPWTIAQTLALNYLAVPHLAKRALDTPLSFFHNFPWKFPRSESHGWKWGTVAVVQRCSVKKVFLEISQNSQENTFARFSFLIKLQASGSQNHNHFFDNIDKSSMCILASDFNT